MNNYIKISFYVSHFMNTQFMTLHKADPAYLHVIELNGVIFLCLGEVLPVNYNLLEKSRFCPKSATLDTLLKHSTQKTRCY